MDFAVALAQRQQLGAGFERVLQLGDAGRGEAGIDGRFVHHEAAAYRVVGAFGQAIAVGRKRFEDHAVGVVGQRLALVQDQVFALDKGHHVATQQADGLVGTDGSQHVVYRVGIDQVRVFTLQTQQHGSVGAVAFAGGAQRAEHFGFLRWRWRPAGRLFPAAPQTGGRHASGRRCGSWTGQCRS